jgi:hypothetical protein
MNCTQAGCLGQINKEVSITLQVSCRSFSCAYPCRQCGRLYWENGNQVFNRQGLEVFLVDGKVVHKDKDGQVVE